MNSAFAILEEAYDSDAPTRSQSRSQSRSRSVSPTTSDETYVIRRSTSPSMLSRSSSPVSSLDSDDYEAARVNVQTHESRSPEPLPTSIVQKPVPIKSRNTRILTDDFQNTETEPEPAVLKQILRIQRDIQKIANNNDEPQKEFPFIEIALFISIGLFILISMNTMLKMGKNHVTYRFSSAD